MKLIKELEDQRIEEAFAKKTYGPDAIKPSKPHPNSVNLTLTWVTEYNGIFISPDDDENLDVTNEMEIAFDRVSETLPSKTYDWASKFEPELTGAQIDELINDAKEIIKHVLPHADISFQYE
jgi:hypothetical protein